jgi:hypothetical protein
MNKQSFHSHDRGKERLGLSAESVDALQAAADRMWYSEGYKKLKGNRYYSNIRDPRSTLLGYAAFKVINTQGKRPRLILASILSKGMRPRGDNISNFINTQIKDNNTVLDVPEKFPGMPKIPGSKN